MFSCFLNRPCYGFCQCSREGENMFTPAEGLALLCFIVLWFAFFVSTVRELGHNNDPVFPFFAATLVCVVAGLLLFAVGWCLEHGAWLVEWLGYYMKLIPTATWTALKKIFGL